MRRTAKVVTRAERVERIAELQGRGFNALADELLASERRRYRAKQQREEASDGAAHGGGAFRVLF